jgi:2-methylcitrate dehydratase PrpD
MTTTSAPSVHDAVLSPTSALAAFASQATYASLPPDVVHMAKRCLLDSIGCGLFGSNTPWTDAVRRVVARLGQAPTASAWGTTMKADPLGAALINGTAAQGYELDDCHDQSMSHYGASVVPAVLAVAQAFGGITGEDLILAIAIGYELGTRIGNTVSPGAFHRGFHPCGLTGTFGAAAAVSKLLALDEEQFVNALGLAGSQAAGLMAAQFGAMAKRFHSGKAAQNGIIAAMSAREGLTGVRDVLEAPYGGFCSTYTADFDLSFATAGLGEDYEIRRNGFKRYSSLASSQTSVDAMRAIRAEHGIGAEDVERVLIETTEVVHRHCGWPYKPNGETITAQMNLPFTAAVTLMDGIAFVDQYVDERLTDPATLDLANRVEVVVDPDLDALGLDEMRIVRATVTTKDGRTLTQTVPYRSGHWKNPLSDEALESKFRDLAGRIVTEDAVAGIHRVVTGLETESEPAVALGEYVQDVR